MSDASKKANTYLDSNEQGLQFVFARIKRLDNISEKVRQYLPPKLLSDCQIANVAGNKLIIIAANASVASQIHFQTADLIEKFQKDGDPLLKIIQFIQCKVQPSFSTPPLSNRQGLKKPIEHLSKETAQLVKDMAESLKDSPLKNIMLKIASRKK